MTQIKPRVVYWNSQPTPYMVERWNTVADRGNIDMHAWFNVVKERDRSWDVDETAWRFHGRYLNPIELGGRQVYLPPRAVDAEAFDLVVQEYASPSMALGFFVSRGLAARVAFRALPTYDEWVSRSRPKEALKHLLFRSADGAKTGGDDGTAMIHRYGMPLDRIHTVTQSIDFSHFSSARDADLADVTLRRNELGVSGCVFLYVGRLWQKKGLTDLFDAFEILQRERGTAVSLIVAGDGIDEPTYRERATRLRNVAFTGFVQRSALPDLYAVADVFVFPTLGDPHGLVIEEAMAAGLPVICTTAAGDIQRRLPDGEAGFIVPPHDPSTMAARMLALQADPTLRASMAQKASEIARKSDHEQYARDFEAFVEAMLSSPPNNSPLGTISRLVGHGINAVRR